MVLKVVLSFRGLDRINSNENKFGYSFELSPLDDSMSISVTHDSCSDMKQLYSNKSRIRTRTAIKNCH